MRKSSALRSHYAIMLQTVWAKSEAYRN